jgi:ADP-ribose pyrophosphatase YjhB (NUDIX family)
MNDRREPQWLAWAREIQALSQTGLHFSEDRFNIQRYQRLMEIAAEIVSRQSEIDTAEALEDFQLQGGYTTPKVDVRGAVIREGRILLVKERMDGRWCMPGGWADVGETPSEMVEREVLEESGFVVRAGHVIGVYDANRGDRPLHFYHAYKIVFQCEILSGEPTPSEETEAVDFFSFDDLPILSSVRTNERHLRDVEAFLSNPARTTQFD